MHFGHGRDFGENFGSDIYSLGIVLFEVLVRRLRQSERKVFSEAEDYDAEEESKWMNRIQSEVRAELTDHAEARDLLLPMIRDRNQQRVKQLDGAIESAERIALCTTEIQQLLDNPNLRPQLIAALSRRSPRSIANLLVKAGEDDFETDADVREFLESELRLAKIYRNGGSSQHPLYW